MSELRPEVIQRLKALELIVLWEGRLATPRLCDWFGISRQQASADIKLYQTEINPQSLEYDSSLRGYKPVSSFRPVYCDGHFNEYLLLVAAHGSEPMAHVMESHPNIAAVQLPDRAVRPETVRELLLACRNPASLRIHYASMANPEPHPREIVPHTLVYSGFRWHVRAFCHKRQQFRDFLLSRIYGQPERTDTLPVTDNEDTLWHTKVSFRLVANSRLEKNQQRLIEHDYAMQNGALTIETRGALVHYSLQRYPVAFDQAQSKNPLAYPLTLHPEDFPVIAPYMFESWGQG